MKKTLIILTFIQFFFQTQAQTFERVSLNKADTLRECYLAIFPPESVQRVGFLVLIPGFGERPFNILEQTDLPLFAAKKGMVTIIPTLHDGVLSLGVDDNSQNCLDNIMSEAIRRHSLANLPVFIGGFSIGGSCAIKFAENYSHKFKAVFAIDPPLDFERYYNSAKRKIRLTGGGDSNYESIYMIDRLEKEIGGTPLTNLDAYHKFSPYSYSDTSQTAIKKLINLPIRIYVESDIGWWETERNTDVLGLNLVDCSGLIAELRILGNINSELILTSGRGFRQPGNRRHPHSWSIVETDKLIDWLLKKIK